MHLVEDGERCLDGALGVVLVRLRDAECCQHRVAGELLDHAAVRLDARRDLGEVPGHAPANDFRIGAGHEGRRADQVDKQYGRELPLHPSSVETTEEGANVPLAGGFYGTSRMFARESGRMERTRADVRSTTANCSPFPKLAVANTVPPPIWRFCTDQPSSARRRGEPSSP